MADKRDTKDHDRKDARAKAKGAFSKGAGRKPRRAAASSPDTPPPPRGGFIREPDKIADAETGATLLMAAAKAGDAERIHRLVRSGAMLSRVDKKNRSAMHYAAEGGHLPALAALFDAGADVNARDRELQTPFFDALSAPLPHAVVERLLEMGLDVNIPTRNEVLPLHVAAARGDLALIDMLFDATHNPNRPDKQGRTPLHEACAAGHKAAIERLLFNRVDIFAATHDGNTALHFAASHSDPGAAMLLLRSKAVGLLNAVNHAGETPLHRAAAACQRSAAAGHKLVAAMLGRGALPNALDEKGFAPLHLAAAAGDGALVHLLSDGGADINLASAKTQLTPLAAAVKGGHLAVAEILLNQGAAVDKADEAGVTPLMHAAAQGHAALVDLLLERGANCALADKQGRNVLHYSDDNLRAQQVTRFVAAGAALEQLDANKRTPLLAALQKYNHRSAAALLEAGASARAADPAGTTALHMALQHRKLALVEKLIEKGADVNARDNNSGQTPLHYAATSGLPYEVGLLMRKGAKHDVKDKAGRTPLHSAMYSSLAQVAEVARVLLEAGADPIARDNTGATAYDVAVATNKTLVVQRFDAKLRAKGVTYKSRPVSPYPWNNGPYYY